MRRYLSSRVELWGRAAGSWHIRCGKTPPTPPPPIFRLQRLPGCGYVHEPWTNLRWASVLPPCEVTGRHQLLLTRKRGDPFEGDPGDGQPADWHRSSVERSPTSGRLSTDRRVPDATPGRVWVCQERHRNPGRDRMLSRRHGWESNAWQARRVSWDGLLQVSRQRLQPSFDVVVALASPARHPERPSHRIAPRPSLRPPPGGGRS